MTRILLISALASGHRRNPDVAAALNKVQQHLFMIASEAGYLFRIVSREIAHVIHTAGRVWAAINQIAKEHKSIGSLVARKHLQQTEQLQHNGRERRR